MNVDGVLAGVLRQHPADDEGDREAVGRGAELHERVAGDRDRPAVDATRADQSHRGEHELLGSGGGARNVQDELKPVPERLQVHVLRDVGGMGPGTGHAHGGAAICLALVDEDPQLVHQLEREHRVERLFRAVCDPPHLVEQARRPLLDGRPEPGLREEGPDDRVRISPGRLRDVILPEVDDRRDLRPELDPMLQPALVGRPLEVEDPHLAFRCRAALRRSLGGRGRRRRNSQQRAPRTSRSASVQRPRRQGQQRTTSMTSWVGCPFFQTAPRRPATPAGARGGRWSR